MTFQKCETEYFIQMLKSALNMSEPAPAPNDLNWEVIFHLCRLNNVESTIYYAVKKLSQKPPQEVNELFLKAYQNHSVREAVQCAEGELLAQSLEKEKIDNLFLKGWVIKNLYPSVEMRSMGDIDVLFKESQKEKLDGVMSELGYKGSELYENVYHYKKPSGITIEMHNSLDRDNEDFFEKPWNGLRIKEGTAHSYEMTDENFYIHMIMHIFRHFSRKGIGVRSIMDVYVYLKSKKSTLDYGYCTRVFEKYSMSNFEEKIRRLADWWFADAEPNDEIEEMGDFIISAGTFGIYKNAVISDFSNKKSRNCVAFKITVILKKFFPTFGRLCVSYPILKKAPVLLPAIWLVRCVRLALFKRKQVAAQLKSIITIKKSDVERLESLHKNNGDMER